MNPLSLENDISPLVARLKDQIHDQSQYLKDQTRINQDLNFFFIKMIPLALVVPKGFTSCIRIDIN